MPPWTTLKAKLTNLITLVKAINLITIFVILKHQTLYFIKPKYILLHLHFTMKIVFYTLGEESNQSRGIES